MSKQAGASGGGKRRRQPCSARPPISPDASLIDHTSMFIAAIDKNMDVKLDRMEERRGSRNKLKHRTFTVNDRRNVIKLWMIK